MKGMHTLSKLIIRSTHDNLVNLDWQTCAKTTFFVVPGSSCSGSEVLHI